MKIELGIITVCVVIIAIHDMAPAFRRFRNWLDRKAIHRKHLDSL